MSKAPSQASGSGSDDDVDSVTSIGERGLLRDRVPEIERGFVLAGRYQVEAVIGKGGSGIVLRAFDRTAQVAVAIKVLKSDLAKDERWSKRFARELRLGRPIRHPNVCRIFDINEADGHKFLTMELASGGTLRDLIKRGGQLRPLDERLADAAAAIGGLAAIHEAGILHRDVKPDNMLRMEDGRLALSDFGLATDLSNSPMVTVMVGTPHYMAPEIRAGEPATTRSDVWSLGVVLHEIFFGRRPERRSSVSVEGTSRPPAPLTSSPIERAMLALCDKCLADDPFLRPSDAPAVQSLFSRARATPGRFGKTRWWPRALGASVVVLGGLAAMVATRGPGRATREAISIGTEVPQVQPTGTPDNWRETARLVASLSGRVFCLSPVDDNTFRVVWGTPRRAEDIDVRSGARRPSKLLLETYANGCPQLSSDGRTLLFDGRSASGMNEIRLSTDADGSQSRTITPGADPAWMRGGERFLYSIDGSHAAVFSLSTGSFSLLPDSGLRGQPMISEKATDQRRGHLAVLFVGADFAWGVAVFEGDTLRRLAALRVPSARGINFDDEDGRILLSYNLSAASSTMTSLDWQQGTSQHLGRYEGFELLGAVRVGSQLVVRGRKRTQDVWLSDGGPRRKLTTDGENYSASISSSGNLLLAKRSEDGRFTIWLEKRDGARRRITNGPKDLEPQFSPDGDVWAYVDNERKDLKLCGIATQSCQVLGQDEHFPMSLRFSPDGKKLAYLTQGYTPQVVVVSVKDGTRLHTSAAQSLCPPVWSSSTTLWAVEGSPGQYAWLERSIISGSRTGNRIDLKTEPGETACPSAKDRSDSRFFQKLTIETEERAVFLALEPRHSG